MFKTRFSRLVLVIAAATISAGELYAAQTEIFDLEERLQARLAREKLRQSMENERGGGADRDDDRGSDCAINVGNVFTDKRIGGKREITVIVTGPIIQANNKCR